MKARQLRQQGKSLQRFCKSVQGGTRTKRAQSLWASVQSLWQASDIPACRRLKKLTVKDIVKPGKAPDLDAKAAEVRYFCHDMWEPLASSKKLQEGSLRDKAMYNVAKHCANMCKHFEAARNGQMVASGEKFLSQYLALEGKPSVWTQKTRKLGGPSQSSTFWATSWMKPERATTPKTIGVTEMKLWVSSSRNCLQKSWSAFAWTPSRESAPHMKNLSPA